jgi:hypothetical protein
MLLMQRSPKDIVLSLYDHHHHFAMDLFLILLLELTSMTARMMMTMMTTFGDMGSGMDVLHLHLHPSHSLQPTLPNELALLLAALLHDRLDPCPVMQS